MFKSFPIVIFICLCTSNVALSQTVSGEFKQLEKVELEALLKPYMSLKTLNTAFTQKKRLSDLNLTLTSSGHLKVERPENILWTVNQPTFLEVEIRGQELAMTTLQEGRKQTQKISFKQLGSQQGSKGLALLVPWLEMDIDKLTKEYHIQEIKSSHLRFTPISSQQGDGPSKSLFRDIELKLTKNKNIDKLVFNEQNGDTIEITFKAAKIEKSK